ncbi:MAG: phosphatidate cytidylyltransferase, partial [Actinomycetota bacterium]|nr:phosphatidate cytidylyltransferase [Actinomycetota bacterium]
MTPDDEPSPAARGLARARRIGGSPARSAPVRPPDDDVAPVLAEGQRSLSLEPRPSRAGRNLPAAIGVGVGLGALV